MKKIFYTAAAICAMFAINSCGSKTPAQEIIDLSNNTIKEYNSATSRSQLNDIMATYRSKRMVIKDSEEYKNYQFTDEEKMAMSAADDSCSVVYYEKSAELGF